MEYIHRLLWQKQRRRISSLLGVGTAAQLNVWLGADEIQKFRVLEKAGAKDRDDSVQFSAWKAAPKSFISCAASLCDVTSSLWSSSPLLVHTKPIFRQTLTQLLFGSPIIHTPEYQWYGVFKSDVFLVFIQLLTLDFLDCYVLANFGCICSTLRFTTNIGRVGPS